MWWLLIDIIVVSVDQAHSLREVQAMKHLSPHPNILQLHELI